MGQLTTMRKWMQEMSPAMRKHPGDWPEPNWRSDMEQDNPRLNPDNALCPLCNGLLYSHRLVEVRCENGHTEDQMLTEKPKVAMLPDRRAK